MAWSASARQSSAAARRVAGSRSKHGSRKQQIVRGKAMMHSRSAVKRNRGLNLVRSTKAQVSFMKKQRARYTKAAKAAKPGSKERRKSWEIAKSYEKRLKGTRATGGPLKR